MAGKLLIVEDDDRVRTALRVAMEDEGYDVAESPDAVTALRDPDQCPPDVILVDLTPDGADGFARIRHILRHHDAPIMAVSARADTHDIVAALEAGADDYVSKPFELKEITARLRALRRRARTRAHTAGKVLLDAHPRHPLVLSPHSGTVRRGDQDLHLTLTEYRLLCELAASPGQALSRRTLLERLGDYRYPGDDRVIDVHIHRLRTKIEKDPGHPRIVVTVRGLGYRLEAPA